MRKFKRVEEPEILKKHCARWNELWTSRCRADSSASFSWYEVDGVDARQHCLPTLQLQTESHCSFCDGYPMRELTNESVEHFRPKRKFPEEAFSWTNLYYCCDGCQKAKGDDWDDLLLRPDGEEYTFGRYFIFDFTTGGIRPNPRATESDQLKAAKTIELYQLDSQQRRRHRLEYAEEWDKTGGKGTLDRWPFRHYLVPEPA